MNSANQTKNIKLKSDAAACHRNSSQSLELTWEPVTFVHSLFTDGFRESIESAEASAQTWITPHREAKNSDA